MFARVGTPLTW